MEIFERLSAQDVKLEAIFISVEKIRKYFKITVWMSIIFFVFAALIAISRVVSGVHYPSDVFVGAVIGITVAYVTSRVLARVFHL